MGLLLAIVAVFLLFMLINRYVFKRYDMGSRIAKKLRAIRDWIIKFLRVCGYMAVVIVLISIALQVFLPDKLKKQQEENFANPIAREEIEQQETVAKKYEDQDISVPITIDSETPQSTSKSMSYEECLQVIQRTATQLGVAPINIVETTVMRMVRFLTSDGSVLVTCSEPDQKLIMTISKK
ncbi:MAG: hypothetical protein D4R63_12020 [Methylococcaceae bacterium]|nr:MAG: hypothetical protein D4R63_12020 [Methylococcaceae bacterium]